MKTHTKQQNNKGFSLIELLVAFAIFAIISTVIVGMMASGMRFFRDNSNNIGLQYEYQTVMTQLREYVVDCNAGIAFEAGATSADPSTLYIVEREPVPIGGAGYIDGRTDNYIYTVHVFRFTPVPAGSVDTGRLDYIYETSAPDPTRGAAIHSPPAIAAAGSMVSTRITKFALDSTIVEIKEQQERTLAQDHPSGIIRARVNLPLDMGFLNGTRGYEAVQDIATRNRVVVADSYAQLILDILTFDAPPSP